MTDVKTCAWLTWWKLSGAPHRIPLDRLLGATPGVFAGVQPPYLVSVPDMQGRSFGLGLVAEAERGEDVQARWSAKNMRVQQTALMLR